MKSVSLFVFLLALVSGFHPGAFAEEPALAGVRHDMTGIMAMVRDLQNTVQDLSRTVSNQNEVIEQQNMRIRALESGQGGTAAVPSASGPTGLAGLAQKFNPEIGVTGTVQAKLTENSEDGEGNDTIALKELELSFAQVVDPYSRFDAIISLNDHLEDHTVHIEEAYLTRWGLPLGITAQLGKFRSKIGKQNLMHLHQLPTAEYPLVIEDFFGEEGLASSGLRLQTHLPNPWDIPVELTGELLRGNNGASFSGISRRPIFNTHVKTYFETTEDSGLELGWTTLFGDENASGSSRGEDRFGVRVFGADATWTWFLPEGRKLEWQNELYFQSRSALVHANHNPWGFYSLLNYRASQRFSAGLRFDYLEPLDQAAGEHGQSVKVSPYIIFHQSEFADFKLQYSHFEPAGADQKSDEMILITADFLIGAHRHPVQ